MSRISHQDIVKQLIETKAVDFDAIGRTFSELGPALSLADEPWEDFCWTMRLFIRIYRYPWPRGPIFEDLGALKEFGKELQ